MSKYLSRIHLYDREKGCLQPPSKPSKAGFDYPASSQANRLSLIYLQRDADVRNNQSRFDGKTDRYCRCGRLAELAWPLEGRQEMWRCFGCLEPRGRA
jgi:hypothetical protein